MHLVLLCTSAHATGARAHHLLLSSGEIAIEHDHVEIRLDIAAEDLLHWHAIQPDENGDVARLAIADAAERHAGLLERVLVLRSADGSRLATECRLNPGDWPAAESYALGKLRALRVNYSCRNPLSAQTSFLVLRLQPDAFPMDIPWQLVLSVRRGSPDAAEIIRLTSRGNTEVLELSAHADRRGLCVREAGAQARFTELYADVTVREEAVDVDVSIPLPLLSTWLPVPVDGDDFLEPMYIGSILESSRKLIEHGLVVQSTQPCEVQPIDVQFASLTGELPAASRINLWTARLQARLRFKLQDPRRATLTWRLFNAGVVAARAVVRCADRCADYSVTTYEPTVSLCDPQSEHGRTSPSP